MIKGIFLMEEPYMGIVSDSDVLSDLDFLYGDSEGNATLDGGNYQMKKSIFKGERFVFTIYESDYDPSLRAMFIAYKVIQNANPDFVKVFKYGENRLITAYPNFSEDGVEIANTYASMMDELLRVTVFLLRNYDPDEATEQLKDYISMSVSYPSNRIGNISSID